MTAAPPTPPPPTGSKSRPSVDRASKQASQFARQRFLSSLGDQLTGAAEAAALPPTTSPFVLDHRRRFIPLNDRKSLASPSTYLSILLSSTPLEGSDVARGTFGFSWETRENTASLLLLRRRNHRPQRNGALRHVTSVRCGDSKATDLDGMQRARAVSKGGRAGAAGRAKSCSLHK